MLQITEKDKLFVIVALPVAIALCYWYFLRRPAAAELSACELQDMSLGGVEQYEAEGMILDKQLSSVRGKLQNWMKASGETQLEKTSASPAERLETILKVFVAQNVRITRSVQSAYAGDKPAKEILRSAFGVNDPVLQTFYAEGFYADVISVLRTFSNRDNRVVVESVSMAKRRAGCGWTISLWF